MKLRHELKHEINLLDYYTISQRLGLIMRHDKNAKANNKYHIRSLYFDNDQDIALRQKLDGLPNREKFRIRIYDLDDSLIRLEKKSKQKNLCSKQSTILSKEQSQKIILGDISWMSVSENPIILDFYSKIKSVGLKPKTIVDYYREAYIYPYGNIRITFDSNIKSGLYSTDLFNKELPTVPIIESGKMVLEVKYDEFLPDIIRDIIQTNVRKSSSYSKYAVCRVYG